MSVKLKAAVAVNLGVAVVCLVVSGLYFVADEITSYHKAVIGVDWSSLAPGVQSLLIILMKGTGDAVFVTAVSIAFFTLIPLRRGENWARWAIVCVGFSCLLPMLVGASHLAITTGAPSPWWANALMILALLAGFFLSRECAILGEQHD